MSARERLNPRPRKGEAVDEAVKEIRSETEAAAIRLIAAVQTRIPDDDDFSTWFINLPEYEEFESLCERLCEIAPAPETR